jgi:hypothetical protein
MAYCPRVCSPNDTQLTDFHEIWKAIMQLEANPTTTIGVLLYIPTTGSNNMVVMRICDVGAILAPLPVF